MIALNKNNILDVYKHFIPDEPFLAIIGTSHTAGDCNPTKIGYTYGKIMADKLGLKFLNLGMSGAFAQDQLEIASAAFDSGLLKNCRLLLIEGRLGQSVKLLSKSPTVEYGTDLYYSNNHGSGMLMNVEQFSKAPKTLQGPINELHSFVGHSNITIGEIKEKLKLHPEQDLIFLSKFELNKLREYIELKTYFESHSPLEIYHDMIIVDAIRVMSNNAGIETYWFNVSGYPVKTGFIESLYSQSLIYKNKTEFDYKEYAHSAHGLSLFKIIVDKFGEEYYNDNLCKCLHGNQNMHYRFANTLLEKLNEARNNI